MPVGLTDQAGMSEFGKRCLEFTTFLLVYDRQVTISSVTWTVASKSLSRAQLSVVAEVHVIAVAAAGPQGVSMSMNGKCHSARFGGTPA